jgi:hypothetical protein
MSEFLWLGVFLIGAIGWITNIISIAQAEVVNGMIVLRAVGIFFFPLGAVLGWV